MGDDKLRIVEPKVEKKTKPTHKQPPHGHTGNRARLSMLNEPEGPTPWMPDVEAHHAREVDTPKHVRAKPEALRTRAEAGTNRELGGGQRYWYRDFTGISGPKGTIVSRSQIQLSVADSRFGTSGPQELNLPPEPVELYPVQISFEREIDYVDRHGRTIHVTVTTSIGMEREQFDRQVGIGKPSYDRLVQITGDSATAALYFDGRVADGRRYFATKDLANGSSSMANMLSQLDMQIEGPHGLLDIVGHQLANPNAATWEQFEDVLRFVNASDTAVREQIEIEESKKAKRGPLERFGLASLGALVSVGDMFYQSVLNIADLSRLLVAWGGHKTGAFEYRPEMWGDVGKATAEQGLTSGDVVKGMYQGIVDMPSRIKDDMARDDPYGFGRDMMQLYLVGRGGVAAVRGSGALAFNAGVRGLSKMGTRGFAWANAIRSWQVTRGFKRATKGIVFPRGMEPIVEYDPVLHITHRGMAAKYDPNLHLLSIGERAFLPTWRGLFPRPLGQRVPYLSLRARFPLRGNLLDMTIRHESWHAYQRVFDPGNPSWRSTVSYFDDPLEFTKPGNALPGAWNKMLEAPPGQFSQTLASSIAATTTIEPSAPTEDDHKLAVSALARAKWITNDDQLDEIVDLEPLAVISGNGQLLVGDDALTRGAWVLFGDDEKFYAVPVYLLEGQLR